MRKTFAEINTKNCRHNIRLLYKMNGEKNFFCGMVKANGYGHGGLEISKVLFDEGASAVGVALVEEGMQLRQQGLRREKILVFQPHIDLLSAKNFLKYKLTPVVCSWASLSSLRKAAGAKKIDVHVKFNTGMNRLGFPMADAEKIKGFFKKQSMLKLTGVCTHFLCGEDWLKPSGDASPGARQVGAKESFTLKQLKHFSQLQKIFSGLSLTFHAHNSASLVAGHCQGILRETALGARPGISLYGVKPAIEFSNAAAQTKWEMLDFKPVMKLKTEVALIQKVQRGEVVSYNATYKCERDSLIGVIPIGYADGFRRLFSNRAHVLCGGEKIPVVGLVCMDTAMIDLTDIFANEKSGVGESVVCIGAQGESHMTVQDLAELIETNSYEIFTGISERVPRVYL